MHMFIFYFNFYFIYFLYDFSVTEKTSTMTSVHHKLPESQSHVSRVLKLSFFLTCHCGRSLNISTSHTIVLSATSEICVEESWTPGLCIGKNLAIRYVSRYRGYDSIYCDTVRKAIYCNFLKSNFRKTVIV